MKRTFQDLRNFSVHARDGALGHVRDLVFAGGGWNVAFLAIDTRRWLSPRQALIRPHDVAAVDLRERRIELTLGRAQVEERPSLATTPAAEAFAHTHPLWSHYWISGGAIDAEMTGHPFGPLIDDVSPEARARGVATAPQWEEGGEGLSWSSPYLVVDCGHWFAGRKTLLPTALIRAVDPRERAIATIISAERWSEAPELLEDELEQMHESEVVEHFITVVDVHDVHDGHELRV